MVVDSGYAVMLSSSFAILEAPWPVVGLPTLLNAQDGVRKLPQMWHRVTEYARRYYQLKSGPGRYLNVLVMTAVRDRIPVEAGVLQDAISVRIRSFVSVDTKPSRQALPSEVTGRVASRQKCKGK